MPVIATSIPVLLLIAYAPKLSLRLGQNGCDLSGNFMIPYTSSVWDATHFFTVTIPLTSCWTQPGALYCKTYSFAEVKVIDLTWDLVVGRGGQAVLVVIAYRLFSSIIRMLMNRGEVGYDMFSTITFNTGDLSSLATLVRHALGCTPIPRTKHAVFTYWAMTLITLYIMGMPTLFSAMTAYTPNYFPSVTIPHKNGSTLTDCGYTLLPAWGAVQDQNVRGITWHSQVIPLLPAWVGNYYMTPKWIDYYHRYEAIYNSCSSKLDIATCPEANITTWVDVVTSQEGGPGYVHTDYENSTVPAPMPGIQVYDMTPPSDLSYSHWVCAGHIFTADELSHRAYSSPEPSGLCNAREGYTWGFSFLITFIVSILTFVFALLMYGLWLDSHRLASRQNGGCQFKDAAMMIGQAQKQYGADVGEWSVGALRKIVFRGAHGMSTTGKDTALRKRHLSAQGSEHGILHQS